MSFEKSNRGFNDADAASVLPASYSSIVVETNSNASFLGFSSNPFASSGQRVAMLANFSTSYNVVNIGYALHILAHDETFQETGGSNFGASLCSSIFIFGVILGQLVGGSLGDTIKHHNALLIMMSLQVTASFGSMLVPANPSTRLRKVTFYEVMALWRLVLGIGCGGVYPLAATMAAESSRTEEESGKLVALTFSTQGIGFLSVPLLTQTLLYVFSEESAHWIWRVILGAGCLPGVLIFVLIMVTKEQFARKDFAITSSSKTSQQQRIGTSHVENLKNLSFVPLEVGVKFCSSESLPLMSQYPPHILQNRREKHISSILSSILQEDKLIRKLSCTAVCWFILDVIFYGNTLFTPLVLEKAFGTRETIFDSMRDSTILSSIALPGYYVSVVTIGYQTPIWVQSQGFMIMSLLYGLIGFNFNYLASIDKSILLLLYGLTFFFSNYGPNTTTFILPSLTFSPGCRSTLNGICAACGKMGAFAGATLFVHTAAKFGDAAVMLMCSGLSLMGLFFTRYGVDSASYLKRKQSCSSLNYISEEHT